MARKGENIRKRKDGRWEARYIKGRKPNGSIQYGYVYAAKYSEVKQKRSTILQNIQLLEPEYPSTVSWITFDSLFNVWEKENRHTVKDSSYFFYETLIEHHLRPYFGKELVERLSNEMVRDFIIYKTEEKLSFSYIHTIMILFRSILRFAQEKRNLSVPSFYFQLPKKQKKNPEIFTNQEWHILEKYLENQTDDFSFGVRLCMYTGLRIGELSGLKWGDISMGQISVRRTIYRIKNISYDAVNNTAKTKLCVSTPKTNTSLRVIPLPYFLLKDINNHRKKNDVFVMTGTTHCMEPRSIQKKYKKTLEKCGLRYLNFHSLRHSFATIGIQKGFDYKTLSEILGHASVNTTMNIYVHSNMERKQQCMNLLE